MADQAERRILGDFSHLALAVRVNCPSWQDLEAALPFLHDLPPDEMVESHRNKDWTFKGQEILWSSTFFHELFHLVQATTRSAFVHRSLSLHHIANDFIEVARVVKQEGNWPPRLPGRAWLRDVAPKLSEKLELMIGVHDLTSSVRIGHPDLVMELQVPHPNRPWTVDGIPRLSDFADGTQSVPDLVVSPDLLQESEATLLEGRFLCYWFGQSGAQVLEQISAGFRRAEYDILPTIVMKSGMAAVFPLLADWAFQMPTLLPPRSHVSTPPARLLILYKAAIELYAGIGFWEVLARRAEIVETLARKTGIDPPEENIVQAEQYVDKLAPEPWRKVFANNLGYRRSRPEAFVLPECFYELLFQRLCVPQLILSGDPATNWHGSNTLTETERTDLMTMGIRAHDALSILFEDNVHCPFCKSRANVGAQPMLEGGYPSTSARCSCGWHTQFQLYWGVDPDSLLPREGRSDHKGDADD